MRASIATHRAHWIACAAVIGLFLLPIVLNLVLHFPGEFDEYWDYATSYQAGGHGLSAAIRSLEFLVTSEFVCSPQDVERGTEFAFREPGRGTDPVLVLAPRSEVVLTS